MREHEAHEYRSTIKALDDENKRLKKELKRIERELDKAISKLEDLKGV